MSAELRSTKTPFVALPDIRNCQMGYQLKPVYENVPEWELQAAITTIVPSLQVCFDYARLLDGVYDIAPFRGGFENEKISIFCT